MDSEFGPSARRTFGAAFNKPGHFERSADERLLRLASLSVLLLTIAACETQAQSTAVAESRSLSLPAFAYQPSPPLVRLGPLEERHGMRIEHIHLSWEEPRGSASTRLHLFRLRGGCESPCPGILILPVLREGRWISRSLGEALAERGFDCIVIEDPEPVFGLHTELEGLREAIVRRVTGARRALDWWLGSGEVDSSRIGVVGVSFGAIVGGLLMEADERPVAAALVLGGGDLPLILERSRERDVREFRTALLERHGWDRARLQAEAARVLSDVDPLRHARRLVGRPILMVNAMFDRVVPTQASAMLWEAAGRPARVLYPTGHYTLALFIAGVKSRIADHLRAMLPREEASSRGGLGDPATGFGVIVRPAT